MSPSANRSEPARVEFSVALTPEQEEMQRHAMKRVRGMRWLFPVFMVFFVLCFLAVVAGVAFVIVNIATHLPQ
jgi:hypothetical protein